MSSTHRSGIVRKYGSSDIPLLEQGLDIHGPSPGTMSMLPHADVATPMVCSVVRRQGRASEPGIRVIQRIADFSPLLTTACLAFACLTAAHGGTLGRAMQAVAYVHAPPASLCSTTARAAARRRDRPRLISRSWGMCAAEPQLSTAGGDLTGQLSDRWLTLVRAGRIVCTSASVRFGLRLDAAGQIAEFQEWTGDAGVDRVAGETLSKKEGPFDVALISNRRLRPPPAAATRESKREPGAGHRKFGEHMEETCSLCSGALRLQLREKAAQIVMDTADGTEPPRRWDAHFNIAPIVKEGHFLLVPAMDAPGSRRKQALTRSDCIDLARLAQKMQGFCVNFNSPGAGATQNHLHLHAWRQATTYPAQNAPVSLGPRLPLPSPPSACFP